MSNAEHLDHRLDLHEIDPDLCRTLNAAAPLIDAHLPTILDDFYRHLAGFEPAVAVLGDHSPERLKQAQREHWQELLSGGFDEGYRQRTQDIGHAHERIGLAPSWYIGGYAFILPRLVDVVLKRHYRRPDAAAATLRALIKAVMLDMDMAISVYIAAGDDKRRQQTHAIADQVEAELQASVRSVSDLGNTLKDAEAQMLDSIAAVDTQAEAVSAGADDTTLNVQIIAAAGQQLSASITGIGQQAQTAEDTARAAAREVAGATATIGDLVNSAEQISQIVKLISGVAYQTNLLALNATIEANRAGVQGKGFAVVAREVKVLANRTAQATKDIGGQVQAIQTHSANAVTVMGRVAQVIEKVGQTASSIVAAIEEQTIATSEIARNVDSAATGTREAAHRIAHLADRVRATREYAATLRTSSEQTTAQIADLEQRVGGLIKNLRTGKNFDRSPDHGAGRRNGCGPRQGEIRSAGAMPMAAIALSAAPPARQSRL